MGQKTKVSKLEEIVGDENLNSISKCLNALENGGGGVDTLELDFNDLGFEISGDIYDLNIIHNFESKEKFVEFSKRVSKFKYVIIKNMDLDEYIPLESGLVLEELKLVNNKGWSKLIEEDNAFMFSIGFIAYFYGGYDGQGYSMEFKITG